MTELPELVWVKGIAARCNWRFPDEFPDGKRYVLEAAHASAILTEATPSTLIGNLSDGRDVSEGDLVWVRVAWLPSFVRQILPKLGSPFVLVTGDAINSVPSQIPTDIRSAIEGSNILHWFAQNCERGHPRISPLPLGLDFHTINDRPFWGEPTARPAEQECLLRSIASELPAVEYRIPSAYADFAWQQVDYGGRFQIVTSLRDNPRVFLQESFLARRSMWRRRGAFAFVISPQGYGLDCHRTWEALALGHIVLISSSPFDSVYEGLAVVPVTDWSTITADHLAEWLQRYGSLTRQNPRLTSAWWIARMRATSWLLRRAGGTAKPFE
jgi:hypothetical protein